MKDRKKIILITVIVIIFTITLLVIYLNYKENNNSTDPGNSNNQNNVGNNGNSILNKEEIIELADYDEFFTIQNILNLNANANVNYMIKEFYIKDVDNTKYYFINCEKFEDDFEMETLKFTKNIYHLVIVNNSKYELLTITDSFDSLEEYAKNYRITNRVINSNKTIKEVEMTIENVLTTYISYFKNLIIAAPREAYNMLSEDTKNKYSSYTDFYYKSINVHDELTAKIFGHNKTMSGTKNIYKVEDDNRNKITIYEESIMNFKISY